MRIVIIGKILNKLDIEKNIRDLLLQYIDCCDYNYHRQTAAMTSTRADSAVGFYNDASIVYFCIDSYNCQRRLQKNYFQLCCHCLNSKILCLACTPPVHGDMFSTRFCQKGIDGTHFG
jgi:hypothetical protein